MINNTVNSVSEKISKIIREGNTCSFSLKEVFDIYKDYCNILCDNYGMVEHIIVESDSNSQKGISFVAPMIAKIMVEKISCCKELLSELISANNRAICSLFEIGHPKTISHAFCLLEIDLQILPRRELSDNHIIGRIKLLFDIYEKIQRNIDKKDEILVNLLNASNITLGILKEKYSASKKFIEYTIILEKLIENARAGEIKKVLIVSLIVFNKCFLPYEPDAYNYLLDDNNSLFTPSEKEGLKNEVFAIGMQEIRFQNHPPKNAPPLLTEKMSFLIPYKSKIPLGKCWNKPIDANASIIIVPLALNAYIDPYVNIFVLPISMPLYPTYLFSDIFNAENCCECIIIRKNIPTPFHEHSDQKVKERYEQAREQKMLDGRVRDEHKQFAIKAIYNNLQEIQEHIDLPREKINIDLFSNYQLHYFDEKDNRVCSSLVFFSNPDSFSLARERYNLSIYHQLNVFDKIKRMIMDRGIVKTGRDLLHIILEAMELVLKNNIEDHECYKYFLNDNGNPKDEPDMQALLYALLRPLLNIAGINIAREVQLRGGELDFLCTYTSLDGKNLSVAIELKKAHHPKLMHGLKNQLPQYMNAQQTKYGIFLVLWFKNEQYPQPTNFVSLEELESKLTEEKPHKITIENLIIDCTKHKPPSK